MLLQLRIAARQYADDVGGLAPLDGGVERRREVQFEGKGLERTSRSALHEFVERVPGKMQKALGRRMRRPTVDQGCGCIRGLLQLELLAGPRISHPIPSIACRLFCVDDNSSGRFLLRSNFTFVRPSPVVRARLPAEEVWIVGWRIVVQEQQDFIPHVGVLVIVPTHLRCNDTVADKENVCVFHVDPRKLASCNPDKLFTVRQRYGTISGANRHGHRGIGSEREDRETLDVGAVVSCRFQAERFHLSGNVGSRKFVAARARCSSFQQIVGEKAYVSQQRVYRNVLHRLAFDSGHRETLLGRGYLGKCKEEEYEKTQTYHRFDPWLV